MSYKLRVRSSQSGFTLIELIIYIGIVSIILTSIISFALQIMSGQTKSSVQQEVHTQARIVSERILQLIRNASDINSVSSTSLSLAETNAAINPTVITYSANRLTVKQGPGSPTAVDLHSLKTSVTNFSFLDYTDTTSGTKKSKHVGFVMTIKSSGGSGRQEYKESATLESSAELRGN